LFKITRKFLTILVYGNSLDGLIAQSYMKQSQSGTSTLKQAKILLNSLSAFCGFSNTDQLLRLKPLNGIFFKQYPFQGFFLNSLPSRIDKFHSGESCWPSLEDKTFFTFDHERGCYL
jgi:hypothetical protein